MENAIERRRRDPRFGTTCGGCLVELGTYPQRDYFFDDSHSGIKTGVKFFDFATDKKVSIANADWSCCGLAVSPDGKSILYTHSEIGESNIMLVKNFR